MYGMYRPKCPYIVGEASRNIHLLCPNVPKPKPRPNMPNSLKLQFSTVPATTKLSPRIYSGFRPSPRCTFFAVGPSLNSKTTTTAPISSEPSIFSGYEETVGSPLTPPVLSFSQWNLTHRHIFILNVIASVVAVSATWLFVSAIPAILAFRRASESLEKLMDTTREELPDTMAAVRLSGMEISDLTMELSDLGQEITQGVRSSTRAVRLAEERLRQFTSMAPSDGGISKKDRSRKGATTG